MKRNNNKTTHNKLKYIEEKQQQRTKIQHTTVRNKYEKTSNVRLTCLLKTIARESDNGATQIYLTIV